MAPALLWGHVGIAPSSISTMMAKVIPMDMGISVIQRWYSLDRRTAASLALFPCRTAPGISESVQNRGIAHQDLPA
jgi:hypothetical protein